MGYNVARKPIITMPNSPLASALGKELHPPILSTLEIYGGQVKRERYIYPIFSCRLVQNHQGGQMIFIFLYISCT